MKKIIRILQVLFAIIATLYILISLNLLWLPDEILKKMGRRGFIVHYKIFPSLLFRGAFRKKRQKIKTNFSSLK